MPQEFALDELFPVEQEPDDRVPALADLDRQDEEGFTLDELFPETKAESPKAAPPVAEEESPGFLSRFFHNLPEVTYDVMNAPQGVISDVVFGEMTPDQKASGKRLFDDLRKVQITRAPLQGAMQFSGFVQNSINRPLAYLSGDDDYKANADAALQIVQGLGEENQRMAAHGLIAQALGPTAGQISETLLTSLTEQFLGGKGLKAAGLFSKAKTAADAAKNASKTAMLYTGLSSANSAMKDANDMGLSGPAKLAYAGAIGGLNAAFIGLGGKLAQKLGLEDVAQAMLKDVDVVGTAALTKAGVASGLKSFAKAVGGAGIEAGEEALTTLSTGITTAAFDGDPDTALDRIANKLKDADFQADVLKAGITGAGARGALSAMKAMSVGARTVAERMPRSIDNLADRIKSRQRRERLARRPVEDTLPDEEPEAPAEATEPEALVEAAEAEAPAPAEAPEAEAPAPAEAPEAEAPAPAEAPEAEAPAPEAEPEATERPLPPEVSEAATRPAPAPPAPETPAPAPQAPGAPPEPQAPRTPPEEPLLEGVSPKNAAMAQQAKRMTGRDIPYSADRVAWNEDIDRAVIANIPRGASAIALSVIRAPRSLSSVETAGMAVRLVELENMHKKASRIISEQAHYENNAPALTAAAKLTDIEEEFFMIREALLKSGTEQGRALAARKMTLNEDFSLMNTLARIYTARRGPVSAKERAATEKIVNREHAVSENLSEEQAKLREQAANVALNKMKKDTSEIRPPQDLLARLAELMKLGCDLA